MQQYEVRMKDPADWKDERVAGSNPCLEQSLESYELCCLVETFPLNTVTIGTINARLSLPIYTQKL